HPETARPRRRAAHPARTHGVAHDQHGDLALQFGPPTDVRGVSLRVLVLCHPDGLPPDSLEGLSEKEAYHIKTEFDVVHALRELGHEVRPLGVQYDLRPIRDAIEDWKPDVVFNLLIEFHGEAVYGQN